MFEKFSKIIDSTDEIIAQNGDKYDIKWLRARCIFHDIPISVKFNSIDTLRKWQKLVSILIQIVGLYGFLFRCW